MNEVISQAAGSQGPDAPADSAGLSTAQGHGVSAGEVVGTFERADIPVAEDVAEDSNGSPVAGVGGVVDEAPVADEANTASAEPANVDGSVAGAPDSLPSESVAHDSAVGVAVSHDPTRVEAGPSDAALEPDAPSEELASDEGDDSFDASEPEGPNASAPDDVDSDPDEIRQRLVRQFETWLDRMDEGEPPPEGLPDELLADALEAREPADALGSDLYTVFAGLTKLSGEIGLQGRAFRQLADVLAPSVQVPGRLDRLEAAQNAVARELARRAEPDKAELPSSEDVLGVLFDLYDRLNRGLRNFDTSYEAARSHIAPVGFLQRLRGSKANTDSLAAPAAAMREGYRLTLSRLEGAFVQWGIQRTGEVGEPFDPRRMAAVEVGTAPGVPDGSVLEVYRSGYVLNGRVLATARVKVAKAG